MDNMKKRFDNKQRLAKRLVVLCIVFVVAFFCLMHFLHIDFSIDDCGDYWVKYDGKIYWEGNRETDYAEDYVSGKLLAQKHGLHIREIDEDHHYLGAKEGGLFGISHFMVEPGYRQGEVAGDYCTAAIDGELILQEDSIRILNEITKEMKQNIVIDQINPLSSNSNCYDLRVGFEPGPDTYTRYPWGFFDCTGDKLLYCFEVQDFHTSEVSKHLEKRYPYKAVEIQEDMLNDELRSILRTGR